VHGSRIVTVDSHCFEQIAIADLQTGYPRVCGRDLHSAAQRPRRFDVRQDCGRFRNAVLGLLSLKARSNCVNAIGQDRALARFTS
jgi:hypothetical protein